MGGLLMGLDMYLSAEKYVGGGWAHVRQDVIHTEGQPPRMVPKDPLPEEALEFDAILDVLKLGPTDELHKRYPDATAIEARITVAYWRKANAVHAWFVDEVQEGNDNCLSHYVSIEKLTELRNICHRLVGRAKLGKPVIETALDGSQYTTYPNAKLDAKLAQEELPSKSGFFFGDTEYDAWYVECLRDTDEQLTKILDDAETTWKGCDFYYRSSW